MTQSIDLGGNEVLHRSHLHWWIWLSPFVLLLLQIFGNGWNSVASGNRIQRAIAADAASGRLITRQALLESFFRSTSQDKTVPLKRLMFEFSMLEQDAISASFWNYTLGENTPLVPTGGVWKEEPLYEAYLSQAKPLIEKLESLVVSDRIKATDASKQVVSASDIIAMKPVWQPVETTFGLEFSNAMFVPQSLNTALIREFDYAIHVGDCDRAIRAIQLEFAVLQMFDWKKSTDAERQRQAVLTQVYSHITHSLDSDIWTSKKLETLQQSIQIPSDLSSRWRSMIEAERVHTLEQFSKPGWLSSPVEIDAIYGTHKYVEVPRTRQWNWLRSSEGITDLGNFGYENLIKLASEKQTELTIEKQKAMDVGTSIKLNDFFSHENQQFQKVIASWKIDLVGFAQSLTSLETARKATMEAVMNKKNDLLAKTSASSLRD